MGRFCRDGLTIYHIHSIIQRDPEVFGDTAEHFVPERRLNSDKIPAGTWRPSERGRRNCIGRELATIVARVLITLIVRRFDVINVGRSAVAVNDDASTAENYLTWSV